MGVGAACVKLSSIEGGDGGLVMARVMPLWLHGLHCAAASAGRSEASIERPGGVEGFKIVVGGCVDAEESLGRSGLT